MIQPHMGESEPFYTPTPDLFGNADAYAMYTTYAAALEYYGLADRFPSDAELRHMTVELLAERYDVEDVANAELELVEEAIVEARTILEMRR